MFLLLNPGSLMDDLRKYHVSRMLFQVLIQNVLAVMQEFNDT